MVAVDVKHRASFFPATVRTKALCESRGGRPGLPVPKSPYGLCGRKATLNSNYITSEFRSCVKVEVAVQGRIVVMVPVDVKQH